MRSGKQVSERNGRNEEEEGRRIKECEHFRERRRNIQQFYSFLMLSGSNKYPECRSFPNEWRPNNKQADREKRIFIFRARLGQSEEPRHGRTRGGSVELYVCNASRMMWHNNINRLLQSVSSVQGHLTGCRTGELSNNWFDGLTWLCLAAA